MDNTVTSRVEDLSTKFVPSSIVELPIGHISHGDIEDVSLLFYGGSEQPIGEVIDWTLYLPAGRGHEERILGQGTLSNFESGTTLGIRPAQVVEFLGPLFLRLSHREPATTVLENLLVSLRISQKRVTQDG